MANVLPKIKQINALQLLCESGSIRGISRLLSVDAKTVTRILRRYGDAALAFLDKLSGLALRNLEVDELHCWVGKKEHRLTPAEKLNSRIGEQWVFYAVDRATKFAPCFLVGKRTSENTTRFMCDLARRLSGRVQISSDGLSFYPDAVEAAFGGDVDYGWCIKNLNADNPVQRLPIVGTPGTISTSLVERANATLRNFVRRCTRKSLCFSKKLENFERALALHFMYYNFVRTHQTIGMPPALKAGVVSILWKFDDMFDALCHHLY